MLYECVCACKETNSSNYNHPSYYRMNAVLENLLLPVESFFGFSFALNRFITLSLPLFSLLINISFIIVSV